MKVSVSGSALVIRCGSRLMTPTGIRSRGTFDTEMPADVREQVCQRRGGVVENPVRPCPQHGSTAAAVVKAAR